MEGSDPGALIVNDSTLASLEAAVADYEGQMTAEGARWLASRGITRETAIDFRLGLVGAAHPGHSRHQGDLCIPYLSVDDAPLSLRFRCIQQHDCRALSHGKYQSMRGEPVRMFNVRAISTAGDTIHVAEGELDAMILTQLGYPAVAIPGVQSFKAHHTRMLAGFTRVFVWADPDDAGADFAGRATRAMRNSTAVRLRPSDGDVNDAFLNHGPGLLAERLEEVS